MRISNSLALLALLTIFSSTALLCMTSEPILLKDINAFLQKPHFIEAAGAALLRKAITIRSLIGVELLLQKVSADATEKKIDNFPLHYAAQTGQTDIIKLLLLHGADPNIQNKKSKSTPLDSAVSNGHAKATKILLLAGAKPTSQAQKGTTIFSKVFNKSHCVNINDSVPKKIVSMLLSAGARYTEKDDLIAKAHGFKGIFDMVKENREILCNNFLIIMIKLDISLPLEMVHHIADFVYPQLDFKPSC